MTPTSRPRGGFSASLRWEVTRWVRSRRVFLLTIPVVAGPIGSLFSFLYLKVGSSATAGLLGILVVGALSGLVVLDLSALSIGEELSRRSHGPLLLLPVRRSALYAGRATAVLGGSLSVYGVGALGVLYLADRLVPGSGENALGLNPVHVALGMLALLFLLGAVAFVAALVTGSASEALGLGILAGFSVSVLLVYLLLERALTLAVPAGLALAGAATLLLGLRTYLRMDVGGS